MSHEPIFAFVWGNSCASRAWMTSRSAWAALTLTPGFIRPMARIVTHPRPHVLLDGRRIARKISGVNAWTGARNPGERTPTTVHDVPLSVIGAPMSDESDPNRRVQSALLSTTTGGAA